MGEHKLSYLLTYLHWPKAVDQLSSWS